METAANLLVWTIEVIPLNNNGTTQDKMGGTVRIVRIIALHVQKEDKRSIKKLDNRGTD